MIEITGYKQPSPRQFKAKQDGIDGINFEGYKELNEYSFDKNHSRVFVANEDMDKFAKKYPHIANAANGGQE